ncbi:MAG: Holliday junction resolvase RuvX [Thiohalomonadales bacterium]
MPARHLTVICFDFGIRRIGVAVGQTVSASAKPLVTLHQPNGSPKWQPISDLISQWQPDLFVLGLPFHADGGESTLCKKVKHFGNQLQARYNLPIEYIDERLSSHEAEQLMLEDPTTRAKQGGDIDHYAAKIILDSWFQERIR